MKKEEVPDIMKRIIFLSSTNRTKEITYKEVKEYQRYTQGKMIREDTKRFKDDSQPTFLDDLKGYIIIGVFYTVFFSILYIGKFHVSW